MTSATIGSPPASYTVDRFDTPTENITDPVPVLYQSGYLTINGYNRRSKIFKLGFPNSEVKQGFSNSLFRYYAPDNIGDRMPKSNQQEGLCRSLFRGWQEDFFK